MAGKAIDITGKRFGKWTVLYKTNKRTNNGSVIWHCKCNCGKEKDVPGYQLRRGSSTSCGCNRIDNSILGKKFGKLTVLSYAENGKWNCQCECGNKIAVYRGSLINGNTQSCGKCFFKDLTGQNFGKLKILYQIKNNNYKTSLWHCQCECGNTIDVLSCNLLNKHILSCGCLKSKGEQNIKLLLEEHNIDFEYNKKINNNKMSFDFIIKDPYYYIEFDGDIHFKITDGWNTKESFKKRHIQDLIKNKYCFEHHIPLIRIPYNKEYTFEDLKLETTRFLLTPENEQKYYENK